MKRPPKSTISFTSLAHDPTPADSSASITLRLCSLAGKFCIVRTVEVSSESEALAVARAHAEPAGYSSVRIADDADEMGMGFRIVARTPGGRGGRNVAFAD